MTLSTKYLNLNSPLKNKIINYINRIPYLTKGLKQSIQTKHILRDKYKKNPTPESQSNYKTVRNKLTGLMQNGEKLYLEEQPGTYQTKNGQSLEYNK